MSRVAALFALLLLASPALAPAGSAQSVIQPIFSILDVDRDGDDLTLTVRSNRDVRETIIRLEKDGTVLGLPDWEKAEWDADEEDAWTFRMLRDADDAEVVFKWIESSGLDRELRQSIFIPDETGPPAGTGAPRILITSATRAGVVVTVNLSNVGDADAENVVVSLEDDQERKIGSPFARTLARIAAGASAQARFDVADDLREAVVAVELANATQRTSVTLLGVAPEEETGETNVTLSTELPFREVDVGRSVDYAVTVRNQGRPSLVQLSVEGLATGYSARFFVGGSAVPSLYLDRNQTRQVTLTVTVPNAASEVDRTLDFTLRAHVNGTAAGSLAMGVAVRGVGRLEVQTSGEEPMLPPGGEATFRVEARNSGTAPIFNVELDSRRPYGWTVRTEPRRIDRLDPGQASSFSVIVRAPDVIAGGRYSLDVAAKSGEVVSTYDTLAVEVEEAEAGGGWLWIVFLVVIAAILGAAAWWRWRG